MQETLSCYHCRSDLENQSSLQICLDGVIYFFCCSGCLAIAKIIHDQGLEKYYERQIPAEVKPILVESNDLIINSLRAYDDPILLRRFTQEISEGILETVLTLEKIRCAACVWLCENYLKKIKGIHDVQINYVTLRANIRYDSKIVSLSELLFAIQKIGYYAVPYEASENIQKSQYQRRILLFRLGVAILGMMQVMMYLWPIYSSSSDLELESIRFLHWTSWLLTLPVILYSAQPFFSSAWDSLKAYRLNRSIGMDVPIALALGISFIFGTINLLLGEGETYFDSITMFVAFLLGARYIELIARQSAQSGSEALVNQLPVICDRFLNYPTIKKIESIPVLRCSVGDVLHIAPGQIIPVDGILLESQTSINEALLTGEVTPVLKKIGDYLYAGTYNINQTIAVFVKEVGQNTRLAGIAKLLDIGLASKPPLVGLSEKWAARFIQLLLIAAIGSYVIWLWVDSQRALMVMVGVLIASCPCALSIAIPTAIASAQGALAKVGLLIMKGHTLETLSQIDVMMMDKTGTLTIGKPAVQEIKIYRNEFTVKKVLSIIAGMGQGQKHPIIQELIKYSSMKKVTPTPFEQVTENIQGSGLTNHGWMLGSAKFLGIEAPFDNSSKENHLYGSVYFGDVKGVIAKITLLDQPRPGVNDFLNFLRSKGIQLIIISGDNTTTVQSWADYFGIENFYGSCSPEEKLQILKQFQDMNKTVCAIGDGVNDAPLLAMANVSIAIGEGAPLAIAGSDAVLLSGSFITLLNTFKLAHKTRVIVQQNLIWAFTYNLIAVPVAMLGLINPWIAGAGMAISSLLVTLNSWRLRKVVD